MPPVPLDGVIEESAGKATGRGIVVVVDGSVEVVVGGSVVVVVGEVVLVGGLVDGGAPVVGDGFWP